MESYLKAKEVLKNNIKGLTELAEILLEKEVIFSEDLERIFGKRKADLLKEEREKVSSTNTEQKSNTSVKTKKRKKSDNALTENSVTESKEKKKTPEPVAGKKVTKKTKPKNTK